MRFVVGITKICTKMMIAALNKKDEREDDKQDS